MNRKPLNTMPTYSRFAVCLATGLGLGLVAPAPGTFGTAAWGLPFAWAVGQLSGIGWQILAICAAIMIGVPLTGIANRALGVQKDHQSIIWDEISTTPIVFLFAPLVNWRIAVAGFLLHRFFDITKPPPARQLERLPEGWGIMADDVMAAVYACAALCAIVWLDGNHGWNLLT